MSKPLVKPEEKKDEMISYIENEIKKTENLLEWLKKALKSIKKD